MSWWVSLQNAIGQVTYTRFGSQKEFETWYNGIMSDGSGEPVSDVYPVIHYQGPDETECARINHSRAEESYSHPITHFAHTIADLGNWEMAKRLWERRR